MPAEAGVGSEKTLRGGETRVGFEKQIPEHV